MYKVHTTGITIITHRNDTVQMESLSEHDKTLTANQNPCVKEPGHLKRQNDRTTDLQLTEHCRQGMLI